MFSRDSLLNRENQQWLIQSIQKKILDDVTKITTETLLSDIDTAVSELNFIISGETLTTDTEERLILKCIEDKLFGDINVRYTKSVFQKELNMFIHQLKQLLKVCI